ncbi:hypothetical protein D3C87_349280 [compost metagenome]
MIFFVSCNKPSNRLDIILSKIDLTDSLAVKINFLQLKNHNSVIYKVRLPMRFNYLDTLKFDNLSDGEYELEYLDIVGDTITNKFRLNDNVSKRIRIVYDSIASRHFLSEIPFNNLKDNELYRIEGKGGSVASMYCYYTVKKQGQDYYFESVNKSKRLLNPNDIKAIQKFEAELLAIEHKNMCISTGRMTYKIVKDGVEHEITDNTCNWNGWSNLMSKLLTNEK